MTRQSEKGSFAFFISLNESLNRFREFHASIQKTNNRRDAARTEDAVVAIFDGNDGLPPSDIEFSAFKRRRYDASDSQANK